jgi:hypothetical protein
LVALGHSSLDTIDPLLAGLDDPITPERVLELIDTVFFGALEGGLADALQRAGALAKLAAQGLLDLPHDQVESFSLAQSSLAWGVVGQELLDAGHADAQHGLT